MPLKEIALELQGKAANLAVRMPIAWVNILAGPPIVVDGRTLDGRTQWLLNLLARMVGAERILEIGTLGGYSTMWLARALQPGGKVVTDIETKSGSHNTICGLDGSRAYLAGLKSPLLFVADTKTNKVIDTVGPIRQVVRGEAAAPRRYLAIFTVDTDGTLGTPVQLQREGS